MTFQFLSFFFIGVCLLYFGIQVGIIIILDTTNDCQLNPGYFAYCYEDLNLI